MWWTRTAAWIYLALTAVALVGTLAMNLLGPGNLIGETAAKTYTFGITYIMPLLVLVAAAECLWRGVSSLWRWVTACLVRAVQRSLA